MPNPSEKISKKKKYNARFPPARIKKIMQTDEEVGKVAVTVPVVISRALELFIESLITKSAKTTLSRNAKTLSTAHIKQTIESERQFDFLTSLVKDVADNGDDQPANDNSLQDGEHSRPRGRPKKSKDPQGRVKRSKNATTKESSEEEEDEDGEETESEDEIQPSRSATQTFSAPHRSNDRQAPVESGSDFASCAAQNMSLPKTPPVQFSNNSQSVFPNPGISHHPASLGCITSNSSSGQPNGNRNQPVFPQLAQPNLYNMMNMMAAQSAVYPPSITQNSNVPPFFPQHSAFPSYVSGLVSSPFASTPIFPEAATRLGETHRAQTQQPINLTSPSKASHGDEDYDS